MSSASACGAVGAKPPPSPSWNANQHYVWSDGWCTLAHDELCAPQPNWKGVGEGNYYMEICKQGVSRRGGRLASMHTSTGGGGFAQLWVKVVAQATTICGCALLPPPVHVLHQLWGAICLRCCISKLLEPVPACKQNTGATLRLIVSCSPVMWAFRLTCKRHAWSSQVRFEPTTVR